MTTTDYMARAELYLGRDWESAAAAGPRAFRTAAQAIRFAVEEAAPVSLRGARLRIGNEEYSGDQLVRLYRDPDYPLPRKPYLRPYRPQTSSTRKEPKWTSSTTTHRPNSTPAGAMPNRTRPNTGVSAPRQMPSVSR